MLWCMKKTYEVYSVRSIGVPPKTVKKFVGTVDAYSHRGAKIEFRFASNYKGILATRLIAIPIVVHTKSRIPANQMVDIVKGITERDKAMAKMLGLEKVNQMKREYPVLVDMAKTFETLVQRVKADEYREQKDVGATMYQEGDAQLIQDANRLSGQLAVLRGGKAIV